MITGIDLVKEQIKVAREQLSFSQEDLEIKGHAIEVRVYANPKNNCARYWTFKHIKGLEVLACV